MQNRKKIIDLTGKRFGRLTVLGINEELYAKKKKVYWDCQCDCGNLHITSGANLRYGRTKSCGCLKKYGQVKDLSGKIFGNIKVLDLNLERSGKGDSAYWNVICISCGEKGVVRGDTIQERGSFSCKCKRTSKNEQLIVDYLTKKNIPFSCQFYYDDLNGDKGRLYFDFKINDFLLEYQGEQHYKSIPTWGGEEGFIKRQEYDKKKREYCKSKGIKLYEITYQDKTIEKLKEILKTENIE